MFTVFEVRNVRAPSVSQCQSVIGHNHKAAGQSVEKVFLNTLNQFTNYTIEVRQNMYFSILQG